MNKIFLIGHTGSINRGCEAIILSTCDLFKNLGCNNINVATYNKKSDEKLGLDKVVKLLNYNKSSKYNLKKIFGKLISTIFQNYMLLEKVSQKQIFDNVTKDDLVLIIGGDTYCYGKPHNNIASNIFAKKKGAKTILWGCSLEKKLIDKEIEKDLRSYDYIVVREQLTFNLLMDLNFPISKIIKMSDPAFTLSSKKNKNYDINYSKKMIGINMSPIILKDKKMFEVIVNFISYIFTKTGFEILLIPHVYDIGKVDSYVLKKIKEKFKDNSKIKLVDEFLGCRELKYIISKCRFFIGARTHSTIAAYSCCIPTLAIGYSVKSKGIAIDIFETYENYVVMIDNEYMYKNLIKSFDYIYENEEKIKDMLNKKIPNYKREAVDAVNIIKKLVLS